jgi:hypothetical protein
VDDEGRDGERLEHAPEQYERPLGAGRGAQRRSKHSDIEQPPGGPGEHRISAFGTGAEARKDPVRHAHDELQRPTVQQQLGMQRAELGHPRSIGQLATREEHRAQGDADAEVRQ